VISRLPGATNDLVSAVLAANPNTIIINQSGTPVEMPWVESAKTLVQAFYGGNELGNGLVGVDPYYTFSRSADVNR
jgi:beta-glucosidase